MRKQNTDANEQNTSGLISKLKNWCNKPKTRGKTFLLILLCFLYLAVILCATIILVKGASITIAIAVPVLLAAGIIYICLTLERLTPASFMRAVVDFTIIVSAVALGGLLILISFKFKADSGNDSLATAAQAIATIVVSVIGTYATVIFKRKQQDKLALEQVRSFLESISTGEIANARHRIGTISYNYARPWLWQPEGKRYTRRHLNKDIKDLFTVLWAFERAEALARSFEDSPVALNLLYGTLGHWIEWAGSCNYEKRGILKALVALYREDARLNTGDLSINDEYRALVRLYENYCRDYKNERPCKPLLKQKQQMNFVIFDTDASSLITSKVSSRHLEIVNITIECKIDSDTQQKKLEISLSQSPLDRSLTGHIMDSLSETLQES